MFIFVAIITDAFMGNNCPLSTEVVSGLFIIFKLEDAICVWYVLPAEELSVTFSLRSIESIIESVSLVGEATVGFC